MTDEQETNHAVARSLSNAGLGTWVILVGGGYGAFLFEGTEAEAEEMRKHKARWEGVVALKRLADAGEIESKEASQCWNHKAFSHRGKGFIYACDCCA